MIAASNDRSRRNGAKRPIAWARSPPFSSQPRTSQTSSATASAEQKSQRNTSSGGLPPLEAGGGGSGGGAAAPGGGVSPVGLPVSSASSQANGAMKPMPS